MTAKEYLRQAYRLSERINSHIEELENLRDLSTRIQGVSYGEHIPSPNRPTDAPFTKVLFKIMDYQEKINHEIDTLVDLKARWKMLSRNCPMWMNVFFSVIDIWITIRGKKSVCC